jgi:hypothetical protein
MESSRVAENTLWIRNTVHIIALQSYSTIEIFLFWGKKYPCDRVLWVQVRRKHAFDKPPSGLGGALDGANVSTAGCINGDVQIKAL